MRRDITRKLFLEALAVFVPEDEEACAAWQLIQEAVELQAITPAMALQALEALQGEADNGCGWDEFSTGADLVNWDGEKYDFSRVHVSFVNRHAFCSRARILDAYFKLVDYLALISL